MKVSKIIWWLQQSYKPDDEVIVAWWDKQLFDGLNGTPIDDGLWNEFVERAQAEIYRHNEVLEEEAMELLNEMNTLEEPC